MSPSGSRMQMDGTSTAARPFCRRASRNSAEGRNTEAAEGFLLSRIAVMAVARRRVEHRSIVIRWRFDQICQAQAPSAESGAGDWPDNCDLMRTRLNVRANLSIGQHRSGHPYAGARRAADVQP